MLLPLRRQKLSKHIIDNSPSPSRGGADITALNSADDRLCVAKITTAHGIKGFVKLKVFTEIPKDIENYNPLYTSNTGSDTLTLTLKNAIKGGWVASIDGITDRNRAEELRNTELFINRTSLPEKEDDEFYYDELINMVVLDNDNQEFGYVVSVQDFGAGDLLEIKPKAGKTFFFPLNPNTCPTIDTDNKTIQTVDIEDYIF